MGCGVFGIYAPGEDVARLTYFGIFTLQHRGQESAGIAVSDGEEIKIEKGRGRVVEIFTEEKLGVLKGNFSIGHVFYPKTEVTLFQRDSIFALPSKENLVLAYNGRLTNNPTGRDDGEIILEKVLKKSKSKNIEGAIKEAAWELKGSYALIFLTKDKIIGLRDPYGIRPLCLGRLDNSSFILASETCTLSPIGAKFVREIKPGEMVVIDENGFRESQILPCKRKALCIFEFIYFARPDSCLEGLNIHAKRKRMGEILFEEHPHPVEVNLVIPIPDTGWPASIGFAEASKIPFGEGLIKNRYIPRRRIEREEYFSRPGMRGIYTVIQDNVKDQRVVVVDDSIFEGNTTREIVALLKKEGGAKEVHIRISSDLIKYPCPYGIGGGKEMPIASRKNVEEICQFIGADSLGYLSLKGLLQAIGLPEKMFCLYCFKGERLV